MMFVESAKHIVNVFQPRERFNVKCNNSRASNVFRVYVSNN